jgi:hypothetical protein
MLFYPSGVRNRSSLAIIDEPASAAALASRGGTRETRISRSQSGGFALFPPIFVEQVGLDLDGADFNFFQ